MMTFTELATAPSDSPEPFTDRLRLAVAAYLARFKGSSREHTECLVPLGKVVFDRLLEPAPGGRVRVVKRAEVLGGAGPLVRLFAPRMRRDTAGSLAALRWRAGRR